MDLYVQLDDKLEWYAALYDYEAKKVRTLKGDGTWICESLDD